jgi:hypothetical protein
LPSGNFTFVIAFESNYSFTFIEPAPDSQKSDYFLFFVLNPLFHFGRGFCTKKSSVDV